MIGFGLIRPGQQSDVTPAPVAWIRRLVKRMWMRGFLPTVLLLLLCIFLIGSWVLWMPQSAEIYPVITPGKMPGPTKAVNKPDYRFAIGNGTILAVWDSTARWQGFGSQRRTLRSRLMSRGEIATSYVDRPIWKWSRAPQQPIGEWRFVMVPGNVQVPLMYLPILAAISPTAAWTRRRRMQPWESAGCRYDLRGIGSSNCPECNRPLQNAGFVVKP